MKRLAAGAVFFLMIFAAVPYLITFSVMTDEIESIDISPENIFIESEESKESEKVSESSEDVAEFESYLIGVVAAEMPALYEIEALKAQAVASRTYAENYIMRTNDNNYMNIGQAYISEEEMKSRWGAHFNEYYNKIEKAVKDTSGEIIEYEGEPIVAVFHALSAGRTESSENIWMEDLPYLKSVDSSFDETAADFLNRKEFSANEFISLLREEYPDISFGPGDIMSQIVIDEYTDAGYVKTITIGNKVIAGTDIRRILDLKSANFTVFRELDKLVFETKGYGHGAGMSQVGANYLAKNGYDYKQILSHYYNGISVTE